MSKPYDLRIPQMRRSARRVLICGSLAYDNILTLEGRFEDHILPEKLHMLNVSFKATGLKREFGGCAGNIAYNLRLLGDFGHPMATVGGDFGPYRAWLERHGVPLDRVDVIPETLTAQAFISTDPNGNQLTVFAPGAMEHSAVNRVTREDDKRYELAVVSPDEPQAMLEHARQAREAGMVLLLDPGQALPLFSTTQLRSLIQYSNFLIVNAYEWQLIQDRTYWSCFDVLDPHKSALGALIVTEGAQGSMIHTRYGEPLKVPAAKASAVVDPTGCGDAYRAGLIHGLIHGHDWEICGRMAALMGALKVASQGGQNHCFTPDEFAQHYREAFGKQLPLAA